MDGLRGRADPASRGDGNRPDPCDPGLVTSTREHHRAYDLGADIEADGALSTEDLHQQPPLTRPGSRSSERRLLVKVFRRQCAVGLDIGAEVVRAMVLSGTRDKARIAGIGAVPIAPRSGVSTTAQAIHAALAQAGADGEPVVAAVGGPDVVVRQLTLPPMPPDRVLPALELQHREFGLLPPSEGLLDAQILRRSKGECLVLAVSAPKSVVDGRLRLLEQAAVKLRTLDVEPLAVLNAARYLSRLEPRELLVALDLGEERALLCLRSEEHTSELQSQSNLVCRLLLDENKTPLNAQPDEKSDGAAELQ